MEQTYPTCAVKMISQVLQMSIAASVRHMDTTLCPKMEIIEDCMLTEYYLGSVVILMFDTRSP